MTRLNNPDGPFSLTSDLVSFAFDGSVDYPNNKPVYVDVDEPSRCLDATQARALVRMLVAGFKSAGLRKGDRVIVHLFNNVLYPPLFFGIIGAEGIYVGSNPSYRYFELDHLFQLAEPSLVITSEDLLPTVLEVTSARNIPSSSIYCIDVLHFSIPLHTSSLAESVDPLAAKHPASVIQKDVSVPQPLEELLAHGEEDWFRFSDETAARTTPAAFFSTSGTSGLPKAAVLSHYALLAQHMSVYQEVPFAVSKLMCMPFFHVFGTLFGHIAPLRYGETIYICARFHLEEFVNAIHRFKITNTFMSPTMLYNICHSALPLHNLLGSLRYVVCGGEGMSAGAQQEFSHHLAPDAVVTQAWGMTEIGAVTLFL